MFIWIEASPDSTTVSRSGWATAAPIAAGIPKPIVPRPPDWIQRRGRSKWKYWAAHIWCWPMSVERMQLPLSVAS